MAKEIEILVPVISDAQACEDALASFEHVGSAHTVDTYFYDPLRQDLQPDPETGRILACMRVRTQDSRPGGAIAYKSDVFEGDEWLYSDEHETHVDDPAVATEVLRKLGLKVLTIIDCVKRVYLTPDGSKEIVYETVKDLGAFLEVENKLFVGEDDAVAIVKAGLRQFIREDLHLDFGEELNAGKPELMLQRQNHQPLEV